MTKFTRKNFRKWLKLLPDEPFCPKHICPIGYFMRIERSMEAAQLDEDLAYLIDDVSVCLPGIMGWDNLIPKDILAILDKLETLKKEQTPVAKPET